MATPTKPTEVLTLKEEVLDSNERTEISTEHAHTDQNAYLLEPQQEMFEGQFSFSGDDFSQAPSDPTASTRSASAKRKRTVVSEITIPTGDDVDEATEAKIAKVC